MQHHITKISRVIEYEKDILNINIVFYSLSHWQDYNFSDKPVIKANARMIIKTGLRKKFF